MPFVDDEPPLRDLFAHTVEAGKSYARAELTYAKRLVAVRAKAAAIGGGLVVAALLFVQAALTVLLAALGWWIGLWLGPAAGLAIAAVIGLVVAGLLGLIGVRIAAGAGAKA